MSSASAFHFPPYDSLFSPTNAHTQAQQCVKEALDVRDLGRAMRFIFWDTSKDTH